MNGNNKDSSRRLLEIDCPVCGAANDPVFSFCEICGARLPKACQTSHIEEVSQSDSSFTQEESDKTAEGENKKTGVKKDHSNKKRTGTLWFIIAILVIIFDGYLIYDKIMKPSDFDQLEVTSQETEEVQESNETHSALHEIEDGDMTVMSWDWDWDSSRKMGEKSYQVDGILHVRNDSAQPAVGMDYSLDEQVVKCWGFVDSGKEGIMVCTLDTDEKNRVPERKMCRIEAIYTNDNLTAYTVPAGRITSNYGADRNSYDVSLTNKNDMSLGADAKLVLVLMKDDKIVESDATGKLTQEVAPQTENYEQKNAFFDPHLYHYKGQNKKAFEVLAIDISALSRQ